MDTVRLVFLCFLLCLSGSSFATIQTGYICGLQSLGDSDQRSGSTPEQACLASAQSRDARYTLGTCSTTPKTCTMKVDGSSYGGWVYGFGSSCPANSTASGATCTCNGGYEEVNGQCQQNNCPSSGTDLGGSSSAGVAVSGSKATTSGCAGGCGFTGSSGAYIPPGTQGAGNFIFGPYKSTGKLCDMSGAGAATGAGAGNPSSGAPSPCGAGKCPGSVNGSSVCVACGAGTQTAESGSSSSTTSSSSTSASGATSSSSSSGSGNKQTSCDGGSCTTTTTTTTTNSDGSSSSSTSSSTEPQSDYCAKNPKAIACKGDDSQWGGACAGGFTCSGDAVQCAQAQASWKLTCDIAGDPTDASVVAGKSAITAGDRPGDHPGNNPDNIQFSANIDQSNPYGSSCPADFTMQAIGATVVVPLSSACDVFQWMGYVAVAFSMFGAAKIAFSGVKGA